MDTTGSYLGPGQFYALDWRQRASTNTDYDEAQRALRLRGVRIPDGSPPTGVDLRSLSDPVGVTALRTHDARWVAAREYDLVLQHRAGRIELRILDGDAEWVRWEVDDDTHPPGQFSF